jgi:NAD(P)-dependent dehydrogenase (short-subunit alcohol dehydrogenase family)
MSVMEGKVAIVTGGGRGIGREECLLLAREGAKVVVCDSGAALDGSPLSERPADEVVAEIKKAGGAAVACFEDVTDFEAAKRIVDLAISSFGGLDALVNNAGIVRDRMLFNMSEAEFDAVIAVHLKGHFNLARWASAYWRAESKKGSTAARHIVNTTSAAGLLGNMGQTNYAAAKAGIAAMTKTWALELASFGVRTNAIAPIARTRMTESTFGEIDTSGQTFDIMSPANIAPLVVYLASDASNEINGEAFGIRGGDLERWAPWTQAKSLNQEKQFTVQEIAKRIGELM